MSIRSGFGAIQEAVDKQDRQQGPQGQSVNFISWDGKESASRNKKIVRFVNSEPTVIGMYSFVRCKDGKNRNFPNTEELASPHEDLIGKTLTRTLKDGKEIPLKPTDQGLALAVVRKEIRNPDGPGVTYEDSLVDIEVDDSEKLEKIKQLAEEGHVTLEGNVVKQVPEVGLIQQSIGNFWKTLSGYYARYGTISDRDYEISRNGAGLDTSYTIIPADPVEDLKTEDQVHQRYAVSLFLHPEIGEWLERLGNKERIAHHLFGEGDSEDGSESEEKSFGSSPQKEQPKPESDSSLKDLITGALKK